MVIFPALALGFSQPRMTANGLGKSQAGNAVTNRMDWFRNAKLGMFIHWGPVSLEGTEIGWSRGAQVPISVYDSLYKRFNPIDFNADRLMALAQRAGMKYVVPITKHHDGFCMFPSKYTSYNISETPYKKDIIGEMEAAAKKHHLVFGTYYSILDWKDPNYPLGSPGGQTVKPHPDMDAHMQTVQNEVKHLIKQYHTRLIWFDGQWEKPYTRQYSIALNNMIRGLDPSIIVNDRVQSSDLQAGDPHGDYHTPEQRVGSYDTSFPWETCMTIGDQWAFKPNDHYKSPAQIIRTLIETVTGDGNLLLNVSPDSTGVLPKQEAAVLDALGAWLKKYGASIYGTRGGPYKNGSWGGTTRKGHTIYFHVLDWGSGEVHLPSLPAKILSQKVLQKGVHAEAVSGPEGLVLKLTGEKPAGPVEIQVTIDQDAWSLGTISQK